MTAAEYPMAKPLVSVVIVNWNTRELLRACLKTLPWDSPHLSLEVIVVDNGSADDSAEMIAGAFPAVKLICNAQNVGFVRANNQGLRAALGEFVFMLNSDTEVRPHCIERLVEVAASDRSIGAVGPRLLNTDGTMQLSVDSFMGVLPRLLPWRFERWWTERGRQRMRERAGSRTRVDWIHGAAVLCRREALERAGPLDERYFMWYDDMDWCKRLARAGLSRVFVPDAEVVHHGRQSGARLDNWRLQEQLFDGEYTYTRIHQGLLATWLVFGSRMLRTAVRRRLASTVHVREDAARIFDYHCRALRRFCLTPLCAAPGRERA